MFYLYDQEQSKHKNYSPQQIQLSLNEGQRFSILIKIHCFQLIQNDAGICSQSIINSAMSLQYLVEVPRVPTEKPKSNYISTTKYNILTFIPLALLLQFKRYANIYFLFSAILQSIPLISPLSPVSAIAPLTFVLALSMVREGYEDFKRWRSDQSDNSQLTMSCEDNQFHYSEWKDLLVGDFVKIQKDACMPADILVLMSSSTSGISYVQTSSLDGEKNLKPKLSVAPMQKHYNNQMAVPAMDSLRGKVQCINPTALIQTFVGRIELNVDGEFISQNVNKKNMMLRGCKLKNTDWVIGLVIYTGLDTAIMMNGCEPTTKISRIQTRLNNIILIILAFQLLCSFGTSVYCYFGCVRELNFQKLLTNGSVSCLQTAAISLGSYFILYNTFIPISLIVSLQFVKVFQGYFMSADREMFCAINQRALECHTVSINEQLGQIEYILTDKTGTLTCNKMKFRNIVVGSDMYGEDVSLQMLDHTSINYQRLSHRFQGGQSVVEDFFDAGGLRYDLSAVEGSSNYGKRELIELIFLMITTCHECVPSSKGGYEGPSPDEVALVNAAAMVGFKFVSSENKTITVEYGNTRQSFDILKLVEFDSDRKRMTLVLRSSSQILVFVKGADTSIEKLLSPGQRYLNDIRQKTTEMTKTGLRSLWFAYKNYPSNVNIDELSVEDIQNNLSLVGATGIEDKLQDFVAQTIYSLRSGGIKFIMLTGDKLETAENIALSCRLIEEGYLVRDAADLQSFVQYLDLAQNQLSGVPKSPVIDGSALSFVDCEVSLLIIIAKVKSVVFCRVTPGQKAQIVRLVKKLGKRTLAIGDGANDVNMIMQAHVGVGIFGEQGTRAAQVANYAIGQFCLLWKLVLYYGRLNYMRVTEMILYFFYKNLVFTSVQLAFSFYTIGSGQSFWLSWSIAFYNLLFTFFPVVIRAVFEVDLEITPTKKTFHALSQGTHEKQTLYSYYPKMYYISQQDKLFTPLIFFAWFILGFSQGVICLILTIQAMGNSQDTSGIDSYSPGFYLVQISVYTSVIIVVTIKLAVNVKNWSIALILGFAVPSIGAYIGYTFIVGIFETMVNYRSMIDLLNMPSFYIIQLLCVGGMFSFDFLLFSIEATKTNFSNYLRFKTLKERRLSTTNLNRYMIEMTAVDENRIQAEL